MYNATEDHREFDTSSQAETNSKVRHHITNSPLLALGAAVGAGALAGLLLRPGSKKKLSLAGRVMKNINGISAHKKIKRDFKAAVGTLTLNYLNRKFKHKLHLR